MSDDHDHGPAEKEPPSLIETFGFEEEVAEDFKAEEFGGYVKTGYPKPLRRLRLVYESERANMETAYYWIHNHLKTDWGYGDIVKTVDTIASAEQSSIWGMIQQRKGIQQDRASQYLQTIGKMIQDLFKLVREIRILKERLGLYDGVKKNNQADDIALKGYWVDMVEGGTRQQANIYVIAQQLGFGTLPDLFFGVFAKNSEDIDRAVEEKAGEFNTKVKEVLRRKLATYIAWRKHTEEELRNRERFTLKYLRQHWAIIRMYISWIKPYLRNVQKLEAPDRYGRDAELVSSFETTMIEIEFVARKAPKGKGKPASTVLASFTYRVKPKLDFHAEGYQHKGPVHIGRVQFDLRCYGWTDEDTDAFVKFRDEETLQLIGMVDQSVRDALDALGDELKRYLKEAGENVDIKEHDAHGDDHGHATAPGALGSIFEPFGAVASGFKDLFGFPLGGVKDLFPGKSTKEHGKRGTSKEAKSAAKKAHKEMYSTYRNYKKQNGMVNW